MSDNIKVENLYSNIPTALPDELITVLAQSPNVRIERIVSKNHVSPPGFWYDQDQDEWVAVVKGHARLEFESDHKIIELHPGDHLTIPAHARHRVAWTAPDEETLWLAVFFPAPPS